MAGIMEPVQTSSRRFRRLIQGVLAGLLPALAWAGISLAVGVFSQAGSAYQAWLYSFLGAGGMVVFGLGGYVQGRLEERVGELMLKDPMTRVYNSLYFFETLETEFANARRHYHALSLLLVDVDRLSHVNVTYGYKAGDAVLASVARVIAESVRKGDTVARVGGEEFGLVLHRTPVEGANILAERIRLAVKKNRVVLPDGRMVFVQVSVGLAQMDRLGMSSGSELFQTVYEAMNLAKESGRDRVCCLGHGDDEASEEEPPA
jgi:diguanylate cyclase (GGDEF)-like protein